MLNIFSLNNFVSIINFSLCDTHASYSDILSENTERPSVVQKAGSCETLCR